MNPQLLRQNLFNRMWCKLAFLVCFLALSVSGDAFSRSYKESKVEGGLTIFDNKTKLSYGYAIKRDTSVREDDFFPEGAIKGDLADAQFWIILSNKELPQQLLLKIMQGKYFGSDDFQGMLLAVKPKENSKGYTWESAFMLDMPLTTDMSGFITVDGKITLADGQVQGKASLMHQQASGDRRFYASFDLPLISISDLAFSVAESPNTLKIEGKNLQGKWISDKVSSPNCDYQNSDFRLEVRKEIKRDEFTGIFFVPRSCTKREEIVEEPVRIQIRGGEVLMVGQKPAGYSDTWDPDYFAFDVVQEANRGLRLMGGVRDKKGYAVRIVLRKK